MDIENNESMLWRKNIKHYTYKERTIVCNFNNGQWLKMSKECFNLLDTFVQENYTYKEILEVFEDTSDRNHIKELIEKLFVMEALLWSSEEDKGEPIKTAHFCITDRCNLSCIHCCASAEGVCGTDPLNTHNIKEIIHKFTDWGIETIIFTGGEPLVRNDFLELLTYTRNNFTGHIALMTNATLINEDTVDIIVQHIDSIDISIDGYDEASCAAIRGKGVYSKVLANMKLLQEAGAEKISLSMVKKDDDDDGESRFRTLCKELGVKPMVRVFADIGRGEISKAYFKNSTKASEPVSVTTDPITLGKKRKKWQDSMRVARCSAAKSMLYIDSHGDLYPCPLLVDEAYNLTNIADIDHIEEALASTNLQAFHSLQPDHVSHCKDCKVQAFCITCYEIMDRHIKRGTLEEYCATKKDFLYDTIWGVE